MGAGAACMNLYLQSGLWQLQDPKKNLYNESAEHLYLKHSPKTTDSRIQHLKLPDYGQNGKCHTRITTQTHAKKIK